MFDFSGGAESNPLQGQWFIKVLNVVGHSWLTCLCSTVWKAGTDSPFQKVGLRLHQVQGITLLTLPGNIYGRVLSVIQTDLVGTMQF